MNLHVLNHRKLEPIKAQIMAKVGVTELEYISYLVKLGTALLAKLMPDAYYYTVLIESNAYWTWYINQFMIIDKQVLEAGVPDQVDFLEFSINGISKVSLFRYWIMIHESTPMAEYFAHANLIEPAENEFIHKKVKEKV